MVISTGVNVVLEVVLCSVVICDFLQPTRELLHVLVGSVGLQCAKNVFVLLECELSEQFIAALFGILDQQSHVVLDSLFGVLAG